MRIKTLQQQQAQTGRIRIGQQVRASNGKMRPAKLETFRFTSQSRALIDAVAAQYGGTPQPWTPEGRPAEHEVVSDAKALPILVPPNPVNQAYEMWSGAGCVRRCDGEIETIGGGPCLCPMDPLERGDLAAKGQACKATTRLNVMLPEIPGIGVWRLDSHGFYAAIELPQTAEFLGAVTDSGGYIRATLALETRQVRRPGVGVRTFLVPALHVDVTVNELAAGGGLAIGAGPATSPDRQLEAAAPVADAAEEPAVDRGALAQELADRAKAAIDLEEIRALWAEANRGALLGEYVADNEGVLEPLGDLIKTLGDQASTHHADGRPRITRVPGLEADTDELWFAINAAAPDGFSSEQLRAFFTKEMSVTPADATAEQMAAFLHQLTAGKP